MQRTIRGAAVDLSHGAVLLAAASALVLGAAEWASPGGADAGLRAGAVLGELARCLLVAYVFARFVVRAGVTEWKRALSLGAWIWLGFQTVILAGAALHEHMPLGVFAVHAGFELARDVAIIGVLGAWRVREARSAPVTTTEPGPPTDVTVRIRYEAVLLASFAAIVVGALWYSPALFGSAWAKLSPSVAAGGARPSPTEGLGELLRSATLAYVMARFVALLRIGSWKATVLFAAWVWLGFHATLLLYSVVHEGMPLMLFAIHAGHGLANDLVIAAILGAWRPKTRRGDTTQAAAPHASPSGG